MKTKTGKGGLPSHEEILAFIANSRGAVGKREVAKAFGVTGAGKIALKQALKTMGESGKAESQRRRFLSQTKMPPVGTIEVAGIDADGEAFGYLILQAGQTLKQKIFLQAGEGRAPKKGDQVVAKIEAQPRKSQYAYTGKVIRILAPKSKMQLAVFRLVKGKGARLVPVDKKAKTEFQVLRGDENGAEDGELVSFMAGKDRGFGLAFAKILDRLGNISDPRNISLIAIHQHNIPNQFSPELLEEVAALPTFSKEGRVDFTTTPLITIDPADARDHDDAVYAEAVDGGFKVIVAIADVAAYVRPGTKLDSEARSRGNSVYFPDLVVPMLPERISNDLCSLREGELRPALVCTMFFNEHGNKISHKFERAVMRSAAKLSYEEAQSAIDGKPSDKAATILTSVLQPLWAAYALLKKAQDKRAPLALDLPERKIILNENGSVAKVIVPPRLDAHRLIEEFMIQANVAAAEELERKKTPLLYREHEQPSAEKIKSLGQFLKTINREAPLGQVLKPMHFNRLLKSAEGEDFEHLLHEVVLRTQAQAIYAPTNQGHFGLALARYAHFTSPIRRYADLIVHRALVSALKMGDDGLSTQDIAHLTETAEQISGAERRAMVAERETKDRLIASFLEPQLGVHFHGRISGVVGAGLFVVLNETGADGFVPVAGLGREYFIYDEVRHALTGEQSGQMFQLGDRVEVRLREVAPVKGGLRFEMVSEGREGKVPSRAGKNKGRRR